MRKGRVPSTHPLYRGLQVEKALALQRGGMRGGVREKEERMGGGRGGKGRVRSRRRGKEEGISEVEHEQWLYSDSVSTHGHSKPYLQSFD